MTQSLTQENSEGEATVMEATEMEATQMESTEIEATEDIDVTQQSIADMSQSQGTHSSRKRKRQFD